MIFPVQMSPFEKRQMMTILDSDFHSDDATPAHCLFLCSCSAYIYYKYLPHKTFFGAGFENKDPPRPPLVVRGSSGLTPLRRRAPGLCHQVRWSVSAPKAVEIIVRKAQYWKGISVTILAGAAWMNTLRLCRLTYPFFYFFGHFFAASRLLFSLSPAICFFKRVNYFGLFRRIPCLLLPFFFSFLWKYLRPQVSFCLGLFRSIPSAGLPFVSFLVPRLLPEVGQFVFIAFFRHCLLFPLFPPFPSQINLNLRRRKSNFSPLVTILESSLDSFVGAKWHLGRPQIRIK